ncbi:MAG: pyridoxal phosphate-dependent aminotransferase, partial [Clostridiales bacterium]|nr:pyridoxal phosphate-dependent aminotransferase [Clostridiales bacterium]
MRLSERVSSMQFSPIRGFNKLAAAEEAKGKKIYHLNIGQPDVETPEVFMDAVRAYDDKVLCYAESNGIPQLLDAIIKYYSLYDIKLTRDNIIITNGGSEALKLVFATVLNPEDEIMVPEPYYTNYISFGCETVAVINPVPTTAEDGYAWAVREKLEAALTPKTRAICCNNPNNPTGRVLTKDDMRVVCEFAKEHNLWIISDEVYREFVYDGGEVTSFGMMDEFADRIVLVDSVSKRYSACGARIGAVISKNEDLMNGVLKLAQGRLCVPTLEQYGAAALFNLGADYLDEARR